MDLVRESLENLQHLSVKDLEQAFRLLENPELPEPLPQTLEELTQDQWESVSLLLFLLLSARSQSRIH